MVVRTALEEAGLVAQDYDHSFRIGATTMAAQQGLRDSFIKTLRKWEVWSTSGTSEHLRTLSVNLHSLWLQTQDLNWLVHWCIGAGGCVMTPLILSVLSYDSI